MKSLFLIPFGLIILFSNVLMANQSLDGETLYVWNFSAKNGVSEQLATDIADEVEQKLSQSGRVTLVSRRDVKLVLDQQVQEKLLNEGSEFPDTVIRSPQLKSVTIFVFGEVRIDKPSGKVRIHAKVYDLNSELYVSATEYCPLFIQYAPEQREAYIKSLIEKILNPQVGLDGLPKKTALNTPLQTDRSGGVSAGRVLVNLFPGGVQFQSNRNVKGVVVASSVICSSLLGYWAAHQRNNNLENATRTEGLDREKFIDQAAKWKNIQNGFLISAVGIYLFSLTDLLRPAKTAGESEISTFEVVPEGNLLDESLSLRLQFRF